MRGVGAVNEDVHAGAIIVAFLDNVLIQSGVGTDQIFSIGLVLGLRLDASGLGDQLQELVRRADDIGIFFFLSVIVSGNTAVDNPDTSVLGAAGAGSTNLDAHAALQTAVEGIAIAGGSGAQSSVQVGGAVGVEHIDPALAVADGVHASGAQTIALGDHTVSHDGSAALVGGQSSAGVQTGHDHGHVVGMLGDVQDVFAVFILGHGSIGVVGDFLNLGVDDVDGAILVDEVGAVGVDDDLAALRNIGAVAAGGAGEDVTTIDDGKAAAGGIDGVVGAENLRIVQNQGGGVEVDVTFGDLALGAAVNVHLRTNAVEVAALRGATAAGVAEHDQIVDGVGAGALHEHGSVVGVVLRVDSLAVEQGAVLAALVNELVEVGAIHGDHAGGGAAGDVGIVVVQADDVIVLAIHETEGLIHAVDDLSLGQIFHLGGLRGIDLFIQAAFIGEVDTGGNAQRVDIVGHGGVGILHLIQIVGQVCAVSHSAVNDLGVGILIAGAEGAGFGLAVSQSDKLGGNSSGISAEGVFQRDFLRHFVEAGGHAVHGDGGDLIALGGADGQLGAQAIDVSGHIVGAGGGDGAVFASGHHEGGAVSDGGGFLAIVFSGSGSRGAFLCDHIAGAAQPGRVRDLDAGGDDPGDGVVEIMDGTVGDIAQLLGEQDIRAVELVVAHHRAAIAQCVNCFRADIAGNQNDHHGLHGLGSLDEGDHTILHGIHPAALFGGCGATDLNHRSFCG